MRVAFDSLPVLQKKHGRRGDIVACPYAIYGAGRQMGMSYLVDGVFDLNTAVALTHNWSAVGFYEHVWSSQWRTSIYRRRAGN